VFATTDPHKLPATILSRVQRYDFKLVGARRIAEHLGSILDREKIKHERGALQLIAREAGGSVRDSLSLLDQVLATVGGAKEKLTEATIAEVLGVADRALIDALGVAILAHDADQALQQIDLAFERGYDLVQLAHALLAHLRDLAVIATVKNPAALVELSEDELARIKKDLGSVPPGLIEMLFDRLGRIAEDMSRSPLPRYALEIGIIELCRTEALEPVGTLLRKLEDLESRLESGAPSGGPPASGGPPRARPTSSAPAPAPSASAPAPAKAPTRATPTDWKSLVEQLLEREARLSGLALARLACLDAKSLLIAFDKEFDADQVRGRIDLLKTTVKAVLGRELAIDIRVGAIEDATATETLIEVEQRMVDEDRDRRYKEAIDHPIRKVLDEQFGGTWKDPVVDNVDKE
jgi:DNA polymerase III gamma/tau subunit